MIDISSIQPGLDLGLLDTQSPRAANILSVQVNSLEYAQGVGIDLAFFLSPDFKFQDASFKSYLIQVLATFGINVTNLVDTVNSLSDNYTFSVKAEETSTALVSR